MAHVPAKFHPDIFNIKTKLDNYDYAYNNNNNSCKVPWAQVSHSPIRSRDLKTNYGILKPIHDFLFNFNGN